MATKWEPPRGIRLIELPNCPVKKYAVQWRSDGKRKTKGFATAEARLEYAKTLANERTELGADVLRLDDAAVREWRTFREQIGSDVPLSSVLEVWRLHGARERLTVAQAIDRLTTARKAEGVAKTTLKHYDAIHKRLRAALGERDAASVTQADIAAWLAGLQMQPWSVRTHFIRARALFTWLRVNRLITHSPCDGMRPPKIVADEVATLTPAQGAELFGRVNCGISRELMGRLALEAFAGVRFSTVAQMTAAEIQFAERGIVLAAAKIKTRRRQFVDGLPDNLWRWLEWSDPATWRMTATEYMHAKSGAFGRACVVNPGNVLRHSFATYHVALHKDSAKTAVILCHSSPRMLWSHYKGRATEADGKAWFEIVPPV